MTPDEIRATAGAAIARFTDPARREEYFATLYDDEVVLHGYTPEPLAGKPAVRAFYQAIFDAFPDCRVTTEQLLVEGDHLTWRFASAARTWASSRARRRAGAGSTSRGSRSCASASGAASSAGRSPTSSP